MKRKQRINNTICYIVLILMSIIWLFPFVGLVLQSFRGESGGMVAYLVPHEWSLKNYSSASAMRSAACVSAAARR